MSVSYICRRCGRQLMTPQGRTRHEQRCFVTLEQMVKVIGSKMRVDLDSGCVFYLRPDGSDDLTPVICGMGGSRLVLQLKLGRKLLPGHKECACHTCDTPHCINWWHLWVGSQSANIRDAVTKGRWWNNTTRGYGRGRTGMYNVVSE